MPVIVCLTLLPFSFAVQALDESFLTDMWDVERGLPDSTVTGITQAPDGYLWISTLSGLARFDGLRFVCFTGPWAAGGKVGDINDMAVDNTGEVWGMAADGELIVRSRDEFTMLKRAAAEDGVLGLRTDNAGGVWASLAGGGIGRCVGGKLEVVPNSELLRGLSCVPAAFPDGSAWLIASNGAMFEWSGTRITEMQPPGLNGREMVSLSVDGSGAVWAIAGRDIWQWRESQWTPVALPPETTASFRGIKTGRDGSVWVWSEAGIWRLAHGEWIRAKVAGPPDGNKFKPYAELIDANGRAWFGTLGEGLVVVSADGHVTVLTAEHGLPSNYIRCLALDHEGNVWAGTQRGLVRIRPKRLTVVSWQEAHAETQATGLVEDADGGVWIGSYGDGLFFLDALKNQNQAMAALSMPKFCRGLVFDHQNRLWVGTAGEGLWAMQDGKLALVKEAELPGGQARSLLVDSPGRLWIGNTKGLYSWADGKLTFHPMPPATRTIDVRAMVESDGGALWIGTEADGLLKWHDEKWEKNPLALPAGIFSIWSLCLDREGALWIGTQNRGLIRWKAGQLNFFNRSNGLPALTICSITQDAGDNVWLGTYEGIFRIKKSDCDACAAGRLAQLKPEVFDRSDGMPTLQCSGSFQPTACRTHDGRLWFPTVKGVVVIDPTLEATVIPPPAVVIEGLTVGQHSLPLETEMTLGPLPKNVAVRFTALDFTTPERVRFRYRLDGDDKEWVEAGSDRSAVFNSLTPGRHMFYVTACGADGIWNERGAALSIKVAPVWWQTWTFRGGATCAGFVLAGAALRHVSTRRLRRQLEEEQRKGALDRERSRIARDIHDELGTSLTRIIMLSQFDDEDSDSSQQRTSLSHIHETAGALTRAMDEVVWAVNPRQDTLEGLVSYVSVFAQEFISGAGLVCRLDLPPTVPPMSLSAEARHGIFLAVKEAINNAVRHASAREIRIAFRADERGFMLEVADDGTGFYPDRAAIADSGKTNGRGGHGLRNMRERLASLGGRCDIESAPGKGTLLRFVVSWPKPVPV